MLASSQAPLQGGTHTPSGISQINGTGKLTFSFEEACANEGVSKKNNNKIEKFFIKFELPDNFAAKLSGNTSKIVVFSARLVFGHDDRKFDIFRKDFF